MKHKFTSILLIVLAVGFLAHNAYFFYFAPCSEVQSNWLTVQTPARCIQTQNPQQVNLGINVPSWPKNTDISIKLSAGPAEIYPNSQITPGAINPAITQANISQNICNPKWSTKSERPSSAYTTTLKQFQLGVWKKGQYNLKSSPFDISLYNSYIQADINTADYEEDHLVSLELGGNPTDPANLWPEPYTTSIPDGGAKSKDSVENYLHREVCAGHISLQEAQAEISTDWYAVYKQMKPTLGVTSVNDENDN